MKRTLRALAISALWVWPLINPCRADADVVLDWNIVTLKPTADSQKPKAGANGHANGHSNGHANGHTNGNGNGEINLQLLSRAGVMLKDGGPTTARSEQFADFQSDAPACDNCGAITVRNGNCYLCHNCGSSMGCS